MFILFFSTPAVVLYVHHQGCYAKPPYYFAVSTPQGLKQKENATGVHVAGDIGRYFMYIAGDESKGVDRPRPLCRDTSTHPVVEGQIGPFDFTLGLSWNCGGPEAFKYLCCYAPRCGKPPENSQRNAENRGVKLCYTFNFKT